MQPLKELGVLVTKWEPKGGSGLCSRNGIIIAHWTPMVTKTLLELVLGENEALLNITILLTLKGDSLQNSRLSLAQERGKTDTRRGGRHGGHLGLSRSSRRDRS